MQYELNLCIKEPTKESPRFTSQLNFLCQFSESSERDEFLVQICDKTIENNSVNNQDPAGKQASVVAVSRGEF